MIARLLNELITLVLFADFLERRFPDYVKGVLVQVSFNLIYSYSKCQLLCEDILRKNPILKDVFKLIAGHNSNADAVLFVKNAQVCKGVPDGNYDFIVSTHETNFKKLHYFQNKEVEKEKREEKENTGDEKIEHCDIKFIFLEFIIDNKPYKIELSNEPDNFNYYLAGNKFTKDFFLFYLTHHSKVNLDLKTNFAEMKCSMVLIDNDVERKEFNFTDKNEAIVLSQKGYNIENI